MPDRRHRAADDPIHVPHAARGTPGRATTTARLGPVMRKPSDPQAAARDVGASRAEPAADPFGVHLLGVSRPGDAAELAADRAAEAMVAGRPAGELAAQPAAIHRFSDENHEATTVAALSGTFSQEEIGEVYASNWERDFSQGSPEIANVALAWKQVKTHAAKHGGDPGPGAAAFRGAADALLKTPQDALAESMGGYRSWEHFDQPGGKANANADARWSGDASGLAGYILDAKAVIKDEMVAAIDLFRELHHLGKIGGKIDNWNGHEKPAGYVEPTVGSVTGSGTVSTTFPKGWNDGRVGSLDPVREETQDLAKSAGAKSDPSMDRGQWRLIGQHLGRAMHAFEDFWAHSNWVQLAHATAVVPSLGLDQKGMNGVLETGTFGTKSKVHSLGHKLVGFSRGLQREFQLVLDIYKRKSASTVMNRPGLGDLATNAPRAAATAVFYNSLDTDSFTAEGELSDTVKAMGQASVEVKAGTIETEDLLCNKQVLAAIEAKGHKMIYDGDQEAGEHEHAKLAKDQPEDGKPFKTAMAVAARASQMVFAPLRKAMDAKDPAEAFAIAERQLALVDQLLQGPTAGHPLFSFANGQ